MAQYARCMGNVHNAAQCAKCARYPRTEAQQECQQWLDHERRATPCDKYIALIRLRRPE